MWAFIMLFSVLWYILENSCILKNASGIVMDQSQEVFFCLEGNSHLSVGDVFPSQEGVSLSECPEEKLSVGVAILIRI